MAFNSGARRQSIMRLDEHSKIPHWYNREDKDQLRTIFCKLESLCHLEVQPGSRMIREFVGSVFRRGVISFEPFVDFSIITICKDRTQGKEQDDFEHSSHMALVSWDAEDGIPCEVEYITAEPTVRYTFGRVITNAPPVHPVSAVSTTGEKSAEPPATVTLPQQPNGGGLGPAVFHFGDSQDHPLGGGGKSSRSGSPSDQSADSSSTPNSPKSANGNRSSNNTTPEQSFHNIKMLTKWYPELLCLPKYPRSKERDADYATKEVVSSASNKARFLLRVRESTEPSRITYTYAAGMPSRTLSYGATGGNASFGDGCGGSSIGSSAEDPGNEIVFFPKYTPPACCGTSTSTSEQSPWGPRENGGAEEEEEEPPEVIGCRPVIDDDDSDGGGGPPEVEWEEDDEWS